ncbi:haloacid dehalogenase-like hydrolase domain-containing protein At2g33255 [Impatiens glandulifera]|uniref:haloacid dehalogenase-like hydrolase domain-containing protein At2g33255 n=1 Tax=Impatiens glandulifera TaxID=253017 RepID=UPI001FB05B0E|nr:haloacid dehalogenase-like hydrolase domain-containing protein At2g33255 [Impatiens glandulifera]
MSIGVFFTRPLAIHTLSVPSVMPSLISRAIVLSLLPPSFPSFMATLPSFTTAANVPRKARLRGVVFDMDGTLTVPVIDFPAMYKAVLGEEEYLSIRSKSPAGIDILHHIENWSPEKQRRAYEAIAEFEQRGLERLQIMPGALELYQYLHSRNIRRGLITRNVKEAVDLFHSRFGITFAPALSREFRPYKPDPAPLLHICSAWEIQPNEVMMIGDSLKDDIACGKRAGSFTCLLDETGRYNSPEYNEVEFQPDYKVSSLAEIYPLLEANFDLNP